MSYSPGSKLSYPDGTSAVVLNEGKVACKEGTFAGKIMSLEDWFLLVGEPSAPAESAEAPRTVGTKLVWRLNSDTYRVAIQTSSCILQVKSVTDGIRETHGAVCRCAPCSLAALNPAPWNRIPLKQKGFNNEAEWRASLPMGEGEVSVVAATAARAGCAATPLKGTTDEEKVKELCERFHVNGYIHENMSHVEELERLKAMQEKTEEIRVRFLMDPLLYASRYSVGYFEEQKEKYSARITSMESIIASNSPAQNTRNTYTVVNQRCGRARLLVTMANDRKENIWHVKDVRRLVPTNVPVGKGIIRGHFLFNSLEEMPLKKENGKPVVEVFYRNKYINVSHLF